MHELQEVAGAFDGLLQARAELLKEHMIADGDRSNKWNTKLAESVKVCNSHYAGASTLYLALWNSKAEAHAPISQTPSLTAIWLFLGCGEANSGQLEPMGQPQSAKVYSQRTSKHSASNIPIFVAR
jgi:hypothetical protein